MCESWLRFARANASPELSEDAVIGNSLWDFIADADCRQLYQDLFTLIRETGRAAIVPFRCDSPTSKRFMEMQISRQHEQHLHFKVRILREQPQPYCPLLDPEVKRSHRWLTMCAWCKRIKDPEDQWLDIFEALEVIAPFEEPSFPNLTHGICSACKEKFVHGVLEKFKDSSE